MTAPRILIDCEVARDAPAFLQKLEFIRRWADTQVSTRVVTTRIVTRTGRSVVVLSLYALLRLHHLGSCLFQSHIAKRVCYVAQPSGTLSTRPFEESLPGTKATIRMTKSPSRNWRSRWRISNFPFDVEYIGYFG